MEDISQVRQKIHRLDQRRTALLNECMRPGKLLAASFYERFTKCSNPNCKCAAGELHGPFPWVYRNKKGKKLISTSCVAEKVQEAQTYSENYKAFKGRLSEIHSLEEEIHNLLKTIESLSEVDASEYTKKKGERRGRKSKESHESAEEEES